MWRTATLLDTDVLELGLLHPWYFQAEESDGQWLLLWYKDWQLLKPAAEPLPVFLSLSPTPQIVMFL